MFASSAICIFCACELNVSKQSSQQTILIDAQLSRGAHVPLHKLIAQLKTRLHNAFL